MGPVLGGAPGINCPSRPAIPPRPSGGEKHRPTNQTGGATHDVTAPHPSAPWKFFLLLLSRKGGARGPGTRPKRQDCHATFSVIGMENFDITAPRPTHTKSPEGKFEASGFGDAAVFHYLCGPRRADLYTMIRPLCIR